MSYSGAQSQQQQSSFGNNNNNFNERRKISDNYGNTSHSIHNLPVKSIATFILYI